MTVTVEKQLSDTYLCLAVPLGYSVSHKDNQVWHYCFEH